MSSSARVEGDWWVLIVTDGLTVEFPPELYRDHDDADREAERWARVLSSRSRASVERPFPDRWEVGDEWIRLISSSLPEHGTEIWVGTYWTRDGSPEPEAELFAHGNDAVAWVRDPAPGAVLVESHSAAWSAWSRYRVRGGEEEAEVHRAKIVASSPGLDPIPSMHAVFGLQVSEGFIPQPPELFADEAARDESLRRIVADELGRSAWQDLVIATAGGNYVLDALPKDWHESWSQSTAIDWLLGYDFIANGADLEIRRFQVALESRT